jgi:pimeloyl-ACP methyl ester carboxylesterase
VIDSVEAPGPWEHRRVAANGARFHLVEAGSGPMVMFLHGFPEFWYAWRHQLPVVADAGFRAVAMDLRGYGGSDKTPRGYDPATLSADIAGVIRSLGESDAVVVGHGWGGYVGWATAALRADQVRALVPVAAPHPLHMINVLRGGRDRLGAVRHLLSLQPPMLPERRIMADDAAYVERLLRARSAPDSGFPDPDTASRYRHAMRLWPAPHCALEYHRWLVRSRLRSDGRAFAARMHTPISQPVLQIHGGLDPTNRRGSDDSSRDHVAGPYRLEILDHAGHFPHEESADEFSKILVEWLGEQT